MARREGQVQWREPDGQLAPRRYVSPKILLHQNVDFFDPLLFFALKTTSDLAIEKMVA